jgi:hypothetical protein
MIVYTETKFSYVNQHPSSGIGILRRSIWTLERCKSICRERVSSGQVVERELRRKGVILDTISRAV